MKFKAGDAFYFKWTWSSFAFTGPPVGRTSADEFQILPNARGIIKEFVDGGLNVHVVMDSHPHLVVRMIPDYCSPHAPPTPPKRSPPLILEIT